MAHAVGIRGWFLRREAGSAADIVEAISGTAVKDNADDLAKVRTYIDHHAARRNGKAWKEFHQARHLLSAD
ncbi:Uncharacterised protein [Mycobacteroides abscessus subsp. abscessus]|nr:Uncharacterised protein [Mycobacteroides abscessus subsp. abscessus]